MTGVVVPAIVAVAFVVVIVFVWLSKPISKWYDTGYDEKHPPTLKEWRRTQAGYTLLLLFLGIIFTIFVWMSTNS